MFEPTALYCWTRRDESRSLEGVSIDLHILLGSYRLLNLAKCCLHDPPQRAFGCGDAAVPANQSVEVCRIYFEPLVIGARRDTWG
jgi:hypothetical protein